MGTGRIVKSDYMQKAPMERIICHWTAGAYQVSDLDLDHYHFCVDGAGIVHRGHYAIIDNLSSADGVYAAHTYGLNTGSIGVAVCCMAGAQQFPFTPGKFPMKREQWLKMAEIVAELCYFYKLPITPRTVLQHGEVARLFSIDQWGKWDCMVTPWDLGAKPLQVADNFRELVKHYLLQITPGVGEMAAPVPPKLAKTKIFWHPKSKQVTVTKDGVVARHCHLALQIYDNKVVAIKLDGVGLNPVDVISGTVELVQKEG
jgi:hypothetical protein